MKIKPLNLLLTGLLIVIIGAFLRIQKIDYSHLIISLGLLFEVGAIIVYLVNRSKKR
ncbi:hypothetical protein FEM08_33740 [Flavobacterium gilvum]|nr:hypothetical protein FEM08_33740 [Flavobacterium gilvum]